MTLSYHSQHCTECILLLFTDSSELVSESAWDIPYLNRKIFLFRYEIFTLRYEIFTIKIAGSIVKFDNERKIQKRYDLKILYYVYRIILKQTS